MSRPSQSRFDVAAIIGLPAAIAVIVVAQWLEGGSVSSLWQPTAALVVFGGTLAAVLVSFPVDIVTRTVAAVWQVFVGRADRIEPMLSQIVGFAQQSRRKGLLSLESEAERTADPLLRAGLRLVIDGAVSKVIRHILEIESHARREADEASADVLETAAGYSPTLGILGAVLGLIHVMESLAEPAKLGAGIAVAFVATVYGVASANLVFLPLATKLRGRAHQAALYREVIIEGVVALQDGLNPRLIEQKLFGYLASDNPARPRRKAA